MYSEPILVFGPLNKKLLIPFLLALNQLIYNIYELYYPGKTNQIIQSYSTSIGHMLILIIPHLKLFSIDDSDYSTRIGLMNKSCSKKNVFHYFLLILFFNMENILLFVSHLLDRNNANVKLPHEHGPFTKESLIIIFIAIISYFLLKYRYYAHNNIAIVFFIIMGIIMDLILDNFEEEYSNADYKIVIINLFAIVFEVVNFCYQKYMIDNLYHNYYNIVFAQGLDLFICNTIAIPLYLANEELKKGLTESFDELGLLIGRFFITMIFQFIYFLLRILTLVYFTPTHLLICLSLSKFLVALLEKDSSIKFYSIIPFVFQFFSLMIFLEIIELNFCGLNENTKRNITLREEEDRLLGANNRNTIDSLSGYKVEYTPGYYFNSSGGNKNNNINTMQNITPVIEMNTQLSNL